jgi:hypothetical protein
MPELENRLSAHNAQTSFQKPFYADFDVKLDAFKTLCEADKDDGQSYCGVATAYLIGVVGAGVLSAVSGENAFVRNADNITTSDVERYVRSFSYNNSYTNHVFPDRIGQDGFRRMMSQLTTISQADADKLYDKLRAGDASGVLSEHVINLIGKLNKNKNGIDQAELSNLPAVFNRGY